MSKILTEAITSSIEKNHCVRIALSGGIDSVALLYACYNLRKNNQLKYFDAIYIDHKTEHGQNGANFCKTLCHHLGVDLIIKSINQPIFKNKEAAWRKERYQLISQSTSLMTHIFLAHHENDQAETFLLNAIRGTGLVGLSSMKKTHIHNKRIYKRPFLQIQRDQLQRYLIENDIKWLDDPSNSNESFKRNFIRHSIIPLIESRWPKASRTIARTSSNLLLENKVEKKINQLRLWLLEVDIQLDKKTIKDILRQLLEAPYDRTFLIKLKSYNLYKHKKTLTLSKQTTPFEKIHIDVNKPITKINSLLSVKLRKISVGFGVDEKYMNDIYIKPRKGGETIQLSSKRPHQKIKKIIQTYDLPPYITCEMPLLYYKDQIIGIPGLVLNSSYSSLKNSYQFSLLVLEKERHHILITDNEEII